MIDRDDLVRTCGGKPYLEHMMRAHPRVQGHSPSAKSMRVDQRMDLAGKPGMPQNFDEDIPLPRLIASGFPMLDRATAAHAEMRAERRDPLRISALDGKQTAPVGMAGYGRNFGGLACERVGNVDVLFADDTDAVAKVSDVIDEETLNHAARR